MLKEKELDSYDVLSKFDTNSVEIGQRQGSRMRAHLKMLDTKQCDEFEHLLKRLNKVTCKGTINRLTAQINAMKADPSVQLRDSSLN